MRGRRVWDADRLQAAVNVVGGAAFAIGSVLFLDPALVRLGVGFFIVGSFAMLLGALTVWRQRYAPRRGDGVDVIVGPIASDAFAEVRPAPGIEPLRVAVTSPAVPGSSPTAPPVD